MMPSAEERTLAWQKHYEVSQRITAHGVGYLFEPNKLRIHYVYWFAVCGACTAACAILCHDSIVSSAEDPVLTTIDSLTYPVEKVPVRVKAFGLKTLSSPLPLPN